MQEIADLLRSNLPTDAYRQFCELIEAIAGEKRVLTRDLWKELVRQPQVTQSALAIGGSPLVLQGGVTMNSRFKDRKNLLAQRLTHLDCANCNDLFQVL
jgi:hypothetical protein